jgi:hypothetical protein
MQKAASKELLFVFIKRHVKTINFLCEELLE